MFGDTNSCPVGNGPAKPMETEGGVVSGPPRAARTHAAMLQSTAPLVTVMLFFTWYVNCASTPEASVVAPTPVEVSQVADPNDGPEHSWIEYAVPACRFHPDTLIPAPSESPMFGMAESWASGGGGVANWIGALGGVASPPSRAAMMQPSMRQSTALVPSSRMSRLTAKACGPKFPSPSV